MLKRGIQAQLLHELHAGALQVESRCRAGCVTRKPATAPDERDRALQRGLAVVARIGADGEHQQAGDDRHPDREAEEHQLGVLT